MGTLLEPAQNGSKHIKAVWIGGRADAVLIYSLLIQSLAACHTLPPLGMKVCWHSIGILLQTHLSGVNIYGGDWQEVIRSRGPFTITQGDLNRIFNQPQVVSLGQKHFRAFKGLCQIALAKVEANLDKLLLLLQLGCVVITDNNRNTCYPGVQWFADIKTDLWLRLDLH